MPFGTQYAHKIEVTSNVLQVIEVFRHTQIDTVHMHMHIFYIKAVRLASSPHSFARHLLFIPAMCSSWVCATSAASAWCHTTSQALQRINSVSFCDQSSQLLLLNRMKNRQNWVCRMSTLRKKGLNVKDTHIACDHKPCTPPQAAKGVLLQR